MDHIIWSSEVDVGTDTFFLYGTKTVKDSDCTEYRIINGSDRRGSISCDILPLQSGLTHTTDELDWAHNRWTLPANILNFTLWEFEDYDPEFVTNITSKWNKFCINSIYLMGVFNKVITIMCTLTTELFHLLHLIMCFDLKLQSSTYNVLYGRNNHCWSQ